MSSRLMRIILAAAVVAVAAAPVTAQNLVINGSFEQPVVNNSFGWDIYDSGTAGLGWTVGWNGGASSYGGQDRPDIAHIELHRGVNSWAHAEGEQHTELDSDWDGPGGDLTGEPASVCIYQDVPTSNGIYYVRYSYSPRPNHGDNAIEVYWDGTLENSHTAGDPGGATMWSDVELELQASDGTTRLEFCETGTPDSFGMFLDDVQVELKELICVGEEVALCAGQTMDIGTVTVNNDETNLYVTFTINEPGWYIDETHVAVGDDVGDIPTTKKGNPIPGQFPYACDTLDPMATTCTATIPLGDWCDGEEIVVAAHAAVSEILGDGCDQMVFWADEVVDSDQGTLKNGDPVAPDRSDPTAVFALGGPFYSLGFDLVADGYADGWLTVAFGYPVYNGPGADIVAQEVTFNRPTYPLERAEVFGVDDGMDYFAGVVTNQDGGDGFGAVSLPDGVTTVEAVKLLDATDPALHAANGDGYDVDAIGACWLQAGEETAWGDGCEGTQFVDDRGWATYFTYTINPCAPPCD